MRALCLVVMGVAMWACTSSSTGAQGPVGPQGPAGPAGVQGSAGASGSGASAQVSGSRLKAIYLGGSDGTRGVFSTYGGPYFDTQFGELCFVFGSSGSDLRCLPSARQIEGTSASTPYVGWADSACVTPVLNSSGAYEQIVDAGVAHYVTRQGTIADVAGPFSGNLYLSQPDGGDCRPAPASGFQVEGSSVLYRAGTHEVAASEFVKFSFGY